MGHWTRHELEGAFQAYQDTTRRICQGEADWNAFAELFTENAVYVEHLFGEMHGREAIRSWIVETMARWPGSEMTGFPIEWYILDEDRGWISCQIWNEMGDPGDGSLHREYNFTLLKYAGDGKWSYEEDIYNPQRFVDMIQRWSEVKGRMSGEPQPDVATEAARLRAEE
jgi:hypothetical protein